MLRGHPYLKPSHFNTRVVSSMCDLPLDAAHRLVDALQTTAWPKFMHPPSKIMSLVRFAREGTLKVTRR